MIKLLFFLLFPVQCFCQVNGFWETGNHTADTVTVIDTDAQAFITAASIVDATQIKAVNRLVLDFKGAKNPNYYTVNMWDSLRVIYPFVGGTSLAHSLNLKNPATHILTFTGTPTHSSNGIVFGSGGYGDPGLVLNTDFYQNAFSMGLYFTTDAVNNADNYSIGLRNNSEQYIAVKWSDGTTYLYVYPGAGANITTADSRGFYMQSYGPSESVGIFKTKLFNAFTATSFSYDNSVLGIGGYGFYNTGITSANCLQNFGFAFFGGYLNYNQSIALMHAVQQFEETLSRQVN